ncbi:molybdopterin oxidoreductase, partial [Bacteroidetes/Chlorobi group bacterium ChocPot_Mid]
MNNNNSLEPNKEFWKSVNEFYNGRAETGEFPDSVKEEFEVEKLPPMSRRKFVALLGASSAFALASCNNYRDKGEIISYNDKPEYANYGDSIYYASTLNDGSSVLIKTREGRPIKIDGNPDHPIFNGKISSQAQANILGLYDPDRLQNPLKKSGSKLILNKDDMIKTDWASADAEIISKLNSAVSSGKEIAIITHSVISPTQKKLFDDFVAKFPTAKIYSYELHNDNNSRLAWRDSFGTEDLPSVKLEDAKIILAFESDFLGTEGNVPVQVRQFASKRNVEDLDNFSRLYSAESAMSMTGMNADYRFRLSPEKQMELIFIIIDEVSARLQNVAVGQNSVKKYSNSNYRQFANANGIDEKKIKYLIDDLVANKEKSLVLAGEKLPVAMHKAVILLNTMLNNNKLFNFSELNILQKPLNGINDFVDNLRNGKVAVVINFDVNPVFHFNLSNELWNKAGTKISLVEMHNESCKNNDFVLPINHALESWNDFNLRSGIYSLQQPVIAPLYDTRQKEAILLGWISGAYSENNYHKYLMDRWEKEVYPIAGTMVDFRKFWYSALHDGVIQL